MFFIMAIKNIINNRILITLTLIFTYSLSSVHAAKIYKRTTCYQTNLGKVCNTESYMKMQAKYTYEESKKIVDNYNKWGDKVLLQYIIGLHPVGGISVLFYNMGAKKCIPYFQNAVKKKTGVLFTYEYVLNNNSHALNQAKNLKVSYVK